MTIRVAALLSHIGHTTISYELAERLSSDTNASVTAISYTDVSIDDIEVSVDTDTIKFELLGARHRFDPAAIRRLRNLLSNGDFDILHTHHNFVGSLGRALAPRDLTIVDTEHADHQLHYSLVQNVINAATLWRSDRVVANSQSTLESFYPLEQLLVPPRKQRVIYNGIDLEAIEAARSKTDKWATDRPRVTTVGRMIKTKNHRMLIDAFDTIRESVPSAEFLFVGDGPERETLERAVRARQLDDHVRFTGTVPRMDVYRILDSSDIFVLPSFSEGFCVALVEAMACGLAPVVSDIPVLREVVGDSAVFADPNSPEEFAHHVCRLLSDNAAREALATAAEHRAETEFPLDNTVQEYYALYEEVLQD